MKQSEIDAIKKIETEQLMKKQAEAERQKRQRQSDLQNEQSHLQQELKSLKGLFTGKRRQEIESRLMQIEKELRNL